MRAAVQPGPHGRRLSRRVSDRARRAERSRMNDRGEYELGINYWPAASAMRWWPEYSHGVFARDARVLADAGCRTVRVFLRWEDFQPRIDQISSAALRSLVDVADTAASNGLRIIPTLFTGHMSGA